MQFYVTIIWHELHIYLTPVPKTTFKLFNHDEQDRQGFKKWNSRFVNNHFQLKLKIRFQGCNDLGKINI